MNLLLQLTYQLHPSTTTNPPIDQWIDVATQTHTHTHKNKKYNNRNNMAERLSVRTQQLSNSTSSCFEYFVFACKQHAYIQTYMIYMYIYIYINSSKNYPGFHEKRVVDLFFFGLRTHPVFRALDVLVHQDGTNISEPSGTRPSVAFTDEDVRCVPLVRFPQGY